MVLTQFLVTTVTLLATASNIMLPLPPWLLAQNATEAFTEANSIMAAPSCGEPLQTAVVNNCDRNAFATNKYLRSQIWGVSLKRSGFFFHFFFFSSCPLASFSPLCLMSFQCARSCVRRPSSARRFSSLAVQAQWSPIPPSPSSLHPRPLWAKEVSLQERWRNAIGHSWVQTFTFSLPLFQQTVGNEKCHRRGQLCCRSVALLPRNVLLSMWMRLHSKKTQ